MRWLSGFFGRKNRERELAKEVQSHLEMAVRERVELGEASEDAERAVKQEFGNVELVREVTRDAWGWGFFDRLAQDLRFGARMIVKSPGFALVAILTLALGIGANTALFSVVNGVLLNPLPYPEPEQLVTLHESKPNFETGSISYPNFRDWQKENHTFSSMAIARGYGFSLTGMGDAEQVRARLVSSDFFSVLGVNPVLGRTFAPGEDEIGAAPIAMISAGLWKRKFSSSPEALGKSLTLDGKEYTIVGVFPANFELFLRSSSASDVYVPIGQWNNPGLPYRGAGLGIHGIGRLKQGVTLAEARADMEHVSRNLAAAYPDTDKGIRANVTPFRDEMLGNLRPVLLVLLGAVGFVLLIACVNVANLLLARSTGRVREFAIRTALGAGKGRLLRQLLTESVLLALAGGGLGLLLAQWATRAALGVVPTDLPRAAEIRIDLHVLIFTMAVSLLAGILFGLAPALKTSQPRLHETLKEGGRGSSGTRHRTQGVFVVMEMAMAVVLLIGAGLMIRTLAFLWDVNPGFNPRNVLTFGVSLPPSLMKAPPDAIRAALRNVHSTLATARGVQALSLSWAAVPIASEDDTLFWFANEPKPTSENDMKWSLSYVVEPDYLSTMQILLKHGRFFTQRDNEYAPGVAVVDEVFARTYFPNVDPVGQRLKVANFADSQVEIVGVVGHVKQWGLDTDDTEQLRAQIYTPYMQLPDRPMALSPFGTTVLARIDGPPAAVLDSLRQASKQMDTQQVIFGAQTMEEIIAGSLAARRFAMILLGVFASLALVLSSVGVYGVISYLVGQRTHEIGVRIALGARRSDVLRLILSHGAKLTLTGILFGLAASFGLTQLMAKMLYGVSPTDPLTFAGVTIVLSFVALAACYVPARRAMNVDPIVALRYE
jgi:predicted permease